MAANNESLLQRLAPVIPVSMPKPSDISSAGKNDQEDPSLPVQGSPLVDLSPSVPSSRWQKISEFEPGKIKLIMIPASFPDAKLVQDETKPAAEIPGGNAVLKLICQQLHEVTGYDAWVYEKPLTQHEGPVSPQEVEQFVSLTKVVAESGMSDTAEFPLSYYVEEQSVGSESEEQTPGLVPLQSLARRAQALINGSPIPKSRGVNIFAVVGKPQAIETPVPQVSQDSFKDAPAATLDPSVKTIEAKPGQWFTLDPVKP